MTADGLRSPGKDTGRASAFSGDIPLGVGIVSEGPARERIRAALTGDRIAVLAEADSVDALVADRRKLDVAVYGCQLAGAVGERGLRALRERWPRAQVVVVSPAASGNAVRKAVEAGAAGVVLEPQLEAALEVTILAAHAGQLSVPRQLGQYVARPKLSFREKQTLGMVVLGFSNLEIAERLYVTESTVKSHLSTAYKKLGVRSRAEAAALIVDPKEGFGPGILTIPVDEGHLVVSGAAKV